MLPCTTDVDLYQVSSENDDTMTAALSKNCEKVCNSTHLDLARPSIHEKAHTSKLPDILTTFQQNVNFTNIEPKVEEQNVDCKYEDISSDETSPMKIEKMETEWEENLKSRTFTTLTVAKDGGNRNLKNGDLMLVSAPEDSVFYNGKFPEDGITEIDLKSSYTENDCNSLLMGDDSQSQLPREDISKYLNESQTTTLLHNVKANDVDFSNYGSRTLMPNEYDLTGMYQNYPLHTDTHIQYSPEKCLYHNAKSYYPVYRQIYPPTRNINCIKTSQQNQNSYFKYDVPINQVSSLEDFIESGALTPGVKQVSKYGKNKDVELVIDYIVNDVKAACDNLDLNTDPKTWPSEQVQKWVEWAVNYNLLPPLDSNSFNIPGNVLCAMSKSEMLKRAPRHVVESSIKAVGKDSVKRKRLGGVADYSYEEKRSLLSQPVNEPEKTQPKIPQAPTSSSINCMTPNHTAGIHLWQFLKELLLQPQTYGQFIRWVDKERGVFKIEDSVEVARLWGIRKNRPAMNYDKLSRSIRQYYKKGIIKKTTVSQRLVYQFVEPSKCLV